MLNVVIGHRGTGKSSFIKRIKYYYQERRLHCQVFDLDAEIEKKLQKSISQIFLEHGESYFREQEISVLNSLIQSLRSQPGMHYVAVGGGFMGLIPADVHVIWLRRPSDRIGRIFLDRPRLENEIAPLEEFMKRYDVREDRFRAIYHRQITLAEGWTEPNDVEPVLLGLSPEDLRVAVTILPEHVENELRLNELLQDLKQWGVRYFELRDDLLSESTIQNLLGRIPKDKILLSFRRPSRSQWLLDQAQHLKCDWAIELGEPQISNPFLVSLHERREGESVDEAAERLLKTAAQNYKLAIPIENFVELWSGHRFYTEQSERRSFLPCSQGRWQWYRLTQKHKMHLNFASLGTGSHVDQPLIFDFIRYPARATQFAAVLGSPVSHSHTPAEHGDFFAKKNMGVVAIEMNEEECNSLNFSILERFGLRAAAITSPLKAKVAALCAHLDRQSNELGAVNTIVLTRAGWSGTNTDIEGLRTIFKTFDMPEDLAVWGGGGTRNVLRHLLPSAHFYSARRGREIWVEQEEPVRPEMVIWALGRARMAGTVSPPRDWHPQYVLDLNYTEDSPGLEYAQRIGAKYISGKAMFKSQAHAQREFWTRAETSTAEVQV